MSANLNIIKRDGSKAEFDKLKIENAILKAMKYGSGVLEEDIAKDIAEEIEKIYLQGSPSPTVSKVEERSEERRVGKECRSRWSPYH